MTSLAFEYAYSGAANAKTMSNSSDGVLLQQSQRAKIFNQPSQSPKQIVNEIVKTRGKTPAATITGTNGMIGYPQGHNSVDRTSVAHQNSKTNVIFAEQSNDSR